MTQRFTYFRSDGTSDTRTQPEGPLPQEGEVWVRGPYTHPDAPSPLDVRVGKAGIKVWMVVQWLQASDSDKQSLLRRYGDVLELADVESALWYYQQNEGVIDQRIIEEKQPA